MQERIKNILKKDYFKYANLHVHSNYSDGSEDFDKIVECAKSYGMKHIAITDHNTVIGHRNSKYKNDEILIPAVEFDCISGYCLVHILGYGIDVNSPEIEKLCAKDDKCTKSDIRRIFKSRDVKKTIEAIHKAGGIAVFAHPCCSWVFNLDGFVKKFVDFGLDGIEVYYPYRRHRGIIKFHAKNKVHKIAEKYGLIMTGGTDEHGELKPF